MARGVVRYLVVPLVALGVFGCRVYDFAEREPWRNEAEQRCLAANPIRASSYLEPAPEIGRGACGMTQPFKVAAIGDGTLSGAREQPAPQSFAARVRGTARADQRRGAPVRLRARPRSRSSRKATLACPLITAVDRWLLDDVQPAAIAWFGEQVVEIRQLSSYACRSINNQPGAQTSEHAYGNALDVAAYRFASGREVTVKDGWRGRPEERGFLRQIHAAACERFSTVLGPGADAFHYDHFHLDLARRSSRASASRRRRKCGRIRRASARRSARRWRLHRLPTNRCPGARALRDGAAERALATRRAPARRIIFEPVAG